MSIGESDQINVTLLGCGVVGSGVVELLTRQRQLLRDRTGLSFDLRHVVVRDPSKNADARAGLPLTMDAEAAIDDPDVHVVIELIGGVERADALLRRAIERGKHVVTANKSLLAERGPTLFALAKEHGVAIAFEASCGGGIPIIDALTKGLAANRNDALVGIVNGTCNFILTKMTREQMSYDAALAEAQAAGFAEADPTLDVSGRDAAQKLAILASIAFDCHVRERDVHVEGITEVQPIDITFARELGYVVKLLAIAERTDRDTLALRVHPTLVHDRDVLADVSGSFNAISVYGHALGHSLYYGRGAGRMPTASAVASDLLSVATGAAPSHFKRLRMLPDASKPADVQPFEQLECRYYLRLMARDVPGVMAQIAEALGRNGISLSAILQHESSEGQEVPVVITTHRAREGSIRQALEEIGLLDTVAPRPACLRIIDQPKEFAAR